jgi:hypothetical protein
MTLPTHPPTALAAGTTVSFTWPATDTALGTVSAAGGWALTWHLRGARVADVTATSTDNLWTLALTASASQALTAGAYSWLLRATLGAQRVDLASGVLTVTPDLVAAGPGDALSWAEKTLAIVEGALTGTLEGEMKMYMIGGRQVMTFSLDELRRERSRLMVELAAKQGHGFGTPIRFDVVGMR